MPANYTLLLIFSQTDIWNDETKLRSIIESPGEKNKFPARGPPLPSGHRADSFSQFECQARPLCQNFANFVLEVPATVCEDEKACRVQHYSKLVSFEARNTL